MGFSMLGKIIFLCLLSSSALAQKKLRQDIFDRAMILQKSNKNKSFVKSWYLLRTLDQISDKIKENDEKMLAALWSSSEKLRLCKNKMKKDIYGFHHISSYNQRLQPSLNEEKIRETPALGSFKAAKQERFVSYDDSISKEEWQSLELIKNDCMFIEEYDEDEISEGLYRNQALWMSLEDFKNTAKKTIKKNLFIEQQQYAIIIQSPKLEKGDEERLNPSYIKARNNLVADLESYDELQWTELEKEKFLYFYDFLLKNGNETYTDSMSYSLLENKKFKDEDKIILLTANLKTRDKLTDLYDERLCYLTSGEYAFYFCAKAIIKLQKTASKDINRRFSLYAEIFRDRKIKNSDKKVAESSFVNELMTYRLDSQTIEIIKNMEGLDNKAVVLKTLVWQKNIRNINKAYKLTNLLTNKTEAREDLFRLLNTGKTRSLVQIFETAYIKNDNKTLRWFSELLNQISQSEVKTIIRYQPLIDGMSKLIEKYKSSQKSRTNYNRFSRQLDPINLNFSSETDKASSFNSKKTLKIGSIGRDFKNFEIKWPDQEIVIPRPPNNKIYLYLSDIENFIWELSYESFRAVN